MAKHPTQMSVDELAAELTEFDVPETTTADASTCGELDPDPDPKARRYLMDGEAIRTFYYLEAVHKAEKLKKAGHYYVQVVEMGRFYAIELG